MSPQVGGEYRGEFADKRMENAWYWSAQLREFMDRQVAGLTGEWYVTVLAGRPVVVVSDEFPDLGGLPTELQDYGFPEWTERDLGDETRLFFEPTDDRPLSLAPEWRRAETDPGYGWERAADGARVWTDDDGTEVRR